MKSGIKIFLLILLVAFSTVLAVSCRSAEAISVSESALPQTVYVRGQEINLSGGVLLVDNGKKTTEVSMASDDVTISGYDKDKLGEQVLTVEYDGVRYDMGDKLGFLQANIEFALNHPTLGEKFREYLKDFSSKL